MVAVPVTVKVSIPTGVPGARDLDALHPVMAIHEARIAKITRISDQPPRWRRQRLGMKIRKMADSAITRYPPESAEPAVIWLGAVVCTVSVELPPAPVTVAAEKLQVVFSGNWEQVRATGILKPETDVTDTAKDAASPE